jgi:hypothetical protein
VSVPAANEIGGRARRGRVVDDENVVPWVLEGKERVEAGGEALRAVPGSDDDRCERGPLEKVAALRQARSFIRGSNPGVSERSRKGQSVFLEVTADRLTELLPDPARELPCREAALNCVEFEDSERLTVQADENSRSSMARRRVRTSRNTLCELDLDQTDGAERFRVERLRSRVRTIRANPQRTSPLPRFRQFHNRFSPESKGALPPSERGVIDRDEH